jgi:hypothetical protein
MTDRALAFACILLSGLCFAQAEGPADAHRVLAAQFAVDYPPGDGWTADIERREPWADVNPFDDFEESVEFIRSSISEDNGETGYLFLVGVERGWPETSHCTLSDDEVESLPDAAESLNQQPEGSEALIGSNYVQDLQQCGGSATDYAALRFAEEEFTVAEIAGMSGLKSISTIDKGTRVIGDKTIYFARWELGRSSPTDRWESAWYFYFPPDFGEQDLFFYQAAVMARCTSRQSCQEMGDTEAPPLAVLSSLEPRLMEEQ